jgi:hypothetical protein
MENPHHVPPLQATNASVDIDGIGVTSMVVAILHRLHHPLLRLHLRVMKANTGKGVITTDTGALSLLLPPRLVMINDFGGAI